LGAASFGGHLCPGGRLLPNHSPSQTALSLSPPVMMNYG